MKIRVVYLYLGYIVWLVSLVFLIKILHLNNTVLGITLVFLTLILTPGVLLFRLIPFGAENNAAKILLIIGLSFGYYFLLNFLAIVTSLSLYYLSLVTFFLILILFIIALIKDCNNVSEVNTSWFKKQSITDYLILLILVISSIFVFLMMSAQSEKLIGDGWFHSAILQKIISSDNLNPYNLWVTKTTSLNLVYSFPIWHILVGEISKLINASIFTTLKQVLLPLSIFTLITWYCLISVIFKNKYLVTVVYLSFFLVFLKDNNFYYLVAVTSPDSFNRLFLLPLIMGIVVNLIFFKKSKNIPTIILISLLAIFLGLVHFIQFIYLIIILVVFVILLFIFFRKKDSLVKSVYLLGGLVLFVLPYLLIHYQSVIKFLNENSIYFVNNKIDYRPYPGMNIIYRYAILILVPILLFLKKYPRLILLYAIGCVSLIIYWPYFGLKGSFYEYLGKIFVDRSLANLPHFIFFGFALFMVLIGINYLTVKLFKKFIWVANILIAILVLTLPLYKNTVIYFVKNILYSETLFFNGLSFWLALFVVIILTITIYVLTYKKSVTIPSPFNNLNFVLWMLLMVIALTLPYFESANKVLTNNPNGSLITDRTSKYAIETENYGGEKTVDFWKSQTRKVFLTDNVTMSQLILLYSDNYVAEYPYGISKFNFSLDFYQPDQPDDIKFTLLNNREINFIVTRDTSEQSFFNRYLDHFKKVYEIHYINKNKNKELYIYQYLK